MEDKEIMDRMNEEVARDWLAENSLEYIARKYLEK